MNLRVITPPTVEPVSVETAKSYLRIDGTADDTLLAVLIAAARGTGEELARRAFITQTLEMTVDAWPADYVLTIQRPPLLTVTSVKYLDRSKVEATWTDYVVDIKSEPARIIFRSLPSTVLLETGGITVRFTAGYGTTAADVPQTIKQAVLLLTAYWFENREMGGVVPDNIRQMFISERVVWF
jgi:uncharacterized phiE125 gp8 family phage protein